MAYFSQSLTVWNEISHSLNFIVQILSCLVVLGIMGLLLCTVDVRFVFLRTVDILDRF